MAKPKSMVSIKWTKHKRIANLINQLGKLNGQESHYGYFKEQGQHPEAKGLTYAELMGIHELRPPEDTARRPVFELSLERKGEEFKLHNLGLIKSYLDTSGVNKKPSPKTLLEDIAKKGIDITKPTFGDPALLASNSPDVILRKGRNSPLVDFGILKEGIAIKTSLRKSIKKFY
jgi:hypothetical protein